MSNHYADFEELRPTGEASPIPDEKLNEGCDGEPRRQRVATTTGGYRAEPTDAGEEYIDGGSAPVTETSWSDTAGKNSAEREFTLLPQIGPDGEPAVDISTSGSGP